MIEMTGAMLAVGAPPLVEEFAITVAAAAVFGYIAQRVGLVSIVGFLAAGVLIGPNALGWIDDLVLVALSSTAVVLKMVVESRRDKHTDWRGRGGVPHLSGHRRGDPRVVGAQARRRRRR
jgi:hypothetical protein